jgi:hypothetical protein
MNPQQDDLYPLGDYYENLIKNVVDKNLSFPRQAGKIRNMIQTQHNTSAWPFANVCVNNNYELLPFVVLRCMSMILCYVIYSSL